MFGIIRYSTNFCWLECEKDLGRMYRRLFLRSYGLKLEAPSNGEHITVVGYGEKDKISQAWKSMEGKTLEFNLCTQLWWNYNALWLEVRSFDIEDLRTMLGLSNPMNPPLHFCIGYIGANNADKMV